MVGELINVLGGAIANFLIGGVWYAIWGEKWIAAWELDARNLDKKDPIPYLIAFIGSVWVSYGMFIMLKHVRPHGMAELLTVPVGMWLFIHVGLGAKHYAFARRKSSAFFIDYVVDLLGLVAIALIQS